MRRSFGLNAKIFLLALALVPLLAACGGETPADTERDESSRSERPEGDRTATAPATEESEAAPTRRGVLGGTGSQATAGP